MELGFLANLSPLDAQSATLSAKSIMTASFTKVVDGPVATLSAEKSAPTLHRDPTRAQMRPYLVAERNVFNAISMASTAHEALGEMANVLEQMRSAVLRAASPDVNQGKAQEDYARLQQNLDTLLENTTFNGVDLLGPNAAPVTVDLGPLDETRGQIELNFTEFTWKAPAASSVSSSDQ
jgi:flagellin-like hook-associated protein FlgL